MSDFRKPLLAFAAATILATVASAQVTPPIVCNTTAQPLTVRAEGLTEQTGDLVISCSGGQAPTPGSALPQVNISVTLTTNITSRLLNDPITEALLFIDDPAPGAQSPCAPGTTVCQPLFASNVVGAASEGSAAGTIRNVFQGVRQNDNTVVFLAVPINAPGSQGVRIFRTKNIRAAVAGSSATNGQIFAFVSIQNPPTNLQLNNSTQNVAFVQTGLAFSLRSRTGGGFDAAAQGATFLFQCDRFNSDLAASNTSSYGGGGFPQGRSFILRYREGYAASFKVRDVNDPLTEPGRQQNLPANNNGADPSISTVVESGFFNTTFPATNGLNRAGRADSGTRLQARFNNVPANVRIFVSAHSLAPNITASATTAARVFGGCGSDCSTLAAAYAVSTGATQPSTVILTPSSPAEAFNADNSSVTAIPAGNGFPAGAAAGLIEVPIVGGTGTFIWEVFRQDPNAIDSLAFAVALAFRSTNNPGLGQLTVNGSFAPISTVNTMNATAPIPRFADQSTAQSAAQIVICQTNLLFPFVSNQAGFDTGIAISNTSSDPFGTAAQSGNCDLNYYGGTTGGGAAPSKQTTTSAIGGGQVLAFTLSSGGSNGIAATPGFQGYIIAQCAYRFAHGFAFVSDVGAQRLSHGYLALVMDNNGTPDSVNRTNIRGENLGQ